MDPEDSAFFPAWSGDGAAVRLHGSRIEGIGRPRVEPCFLPGRHRRDDPRPGRGLGRRHAGCCTTAPAGPAGPSTGTNIYGALQLACAMAGRGERGSIVSLVCDRSDRYAATHWSPDWLVEHGLDPSPYAAYLASAWDSATWHTD